MPRGVPRKAELLPEARRLRAQGLYGREIAARLGVALTTVYDWLDNPNRVKADERRERYSRPCPDCGTPMNGSDGRGPNAPALCKMCNGHRQGEAMRQAGIARAHEWEAMWASGMTSRQIAETVGWTPAAAKAQISKLRALGYTFAYRRADCVEIGRRLAIRRHGERVAA